MTGWRLGYLHLNNKEILDRVRKAVLYTCNGVNSIAQYAGLAALTGPQGCTREFCASFQKKRDVFYEALRDVPIFDVRKPLGAFYFFPRITEAYSGVNGDRSDVALCRQLIAEAQIGNTPGRIFGRAGEGFLRFSYACSLDHIQRAADTLRSLFAEVAAA
jgi:aspartate aminotransferase